MQLCNYLALIFGSAVSAHIVLESPTSVGFDEEKAATAPCGSFDINNRTTVTQWPVSGAPLHILSVDNSANMTINFAMANGTNTKFTKALVVDMTGTGDLCLPAVKPPASMMNMAGMDMTLQVVANTDDGKIYQCASIKMAAALTQAAPLPAGCKNSTGVKATLGN